MNKIYALLPLLLLTGCVSGPEGSAAEYSAVPTIQDAEVQHSVEILSVCETRTQEQTAVQISGNSGNSVVAGAIIGAVIGAGIGGNSPDPNLIAAGALAGSAIAGNAFPDEYHSSPVIKATQITYLFKGRVCHLDVTQSACSFKVGAAILAVKGKFKTIIPNNPQGCNHEQ